MYTYFYLPKLTVEKRISIQVHVITPSVPGNTGTRLTKLDRENKGESELWTYQVYVLRVFRYKSKECFLKMQERENSLSGKLNSNLR